MLSTSTLPWNADGFFSIHILSLIKCIPSEIMIYQTEFSQTSCINWHFAKSSCYVCGSCTNHVAIVNFLQISAHHFNPAILVTPLYTLPYSLKVYKSYQQVSTNSIFFMSYFYTLLKLLNTILCIDLSNCDMSCQFEK